MQFGLAPLQRGESRFETVAGRTRDVSGEGLCLETNTVMMGRIHVLAEAMDGENRLLLTIEIPDGESPLEALGAVIWYDLAPKDSDFHFRAGVLFTEMGEEASKRWRNFLSTVRSRRIF